MDTLTARDAADFLGVQVSTLYAYVSRGLIESIPASDDPRKRLYRRVDLERLKRRSDAHSGEGAAAAGALDWGAPSLETRISQITSSGPRYRGELALELVDGQRSFEEIAEYLWTSDWSEDVNWSGWRSSVSPVSESMDVGVRPIDQLRVAVARAGLRDIGRFSESRDGRLACARRIYGVLLGTLTMLEGRDFGDLADAGVVSSVSAAFGLGECAEVRSALRAALILIADHEMNASTFAARVTASTGADLYACIEAAMAALSGPRHGGAAERCEALLSEIDGASTVADALLRRVRRGDSIPGFGHPLYPDGDPRFRKLCTMLSGLSDAHLELAADLEDAADDLQLGAPTIDLGLAILSDALGFVDGGASILFALGRLAGWIAHSLEQLQEERLLRPRASYVGD